MTILGLLRELIAATWWHSRTLRRLRRWGVALALAIFLIALVAGVYDTPPAEGPR